MTEPVTMHEWIFYATDSDRSWGWSNHVQSLGAAFSGFGATAELALAEARAAEREDFRYYCDGIERFVDGETEDSLTAIPAEAGVGVTFDLPPVSDSEAH